MEFKINSHLSIRFENPDTNIYVNGKRYKKCVRLVLNIPKDNTSDFKNIESIDEAADLYQNLLKGQILDEEMHEGGGIIPPETEFWAHCSNLQAWYENGYDTRLIHYTLAFSLLMELTKAGDSLAKSVFKKEIAQRFASGYPTVVQYLIEQDYLRFLNSEELSTLIESWDPKFLLKIRHKSAYMFVKKAPERVGKLLWNIVKEDVERKDYKNLFRIVLNYSEFLNSDNVEEIFMGLDYDLILEYEYPFKILRLLTIAGLSGATDALREHLVRRMNNANVKIIHFILENFLRAINPKSLKLESLDIDYRKISETFPNLIIPFLIKMIQFGLEGARAFYESEEFLGKYLDSSEVQPFLDLCRSTKTSILISRPYLKSSWDVAHPPSVTLTKDRKIVIINLYGAGVSEVHPSIGKLYYLTEIHLTGNPINTLPTSLKHLHFLRDIYIRNAKFVDFPDILFEIASLENIVLDCNQIRHVPDRFDPLKSLKNLELNRNRIQSVPNSLLKLKNLETLNLDFNEVEVLPDNFEGLPHIKKIFLEYNKIDRLPPSLGNNPCLNRLHVGGNPIISIPESFITSKLKYFSIYLDHLDDKSLTTLNELENNNISILKPPYSIKFSFKNTLHYVHSGDKNTIVKYSRFIYPKKLPLSLDLIDSLDRTYSKFKLNFERISYPSDCIELTSEALDQIKSELGKNFKVFINQE